MSSAANVVNDLLTVCSSAELADGLGISSTDDLSVETLARALDQVGPSVPEKLSGILGPLLLKRIMTSLELDTTGGDLAELTHRWLTKRRFILDEPINIETYPQRLYLDLEERLDLLRDRPGTYALSKSLVPELMRLFRLLIAYYFQAFGGADEKLSFVRETLQDQPATAGQVPLADDSIHAILETLDLSALHRILICLDEVRAIPYDSSSLASHVLLEGDESAFLERAVSLSWKIISGSGSEQEGEVWCENISRLLTSWNERLGHQTLVPVGAVVVDAVIEDGSRSLSCNCEVGESAKLHHVPTDVDIGATVLLAASSTQFARTGDRLSPLPCESAWKTVDIGFNEESFAVTQPSTLEPPSVFLSYNHCDNVTAERIRLALEHAGIKVRVDVKNMVAGEDVRRFIVDSVAKTEFSVCLVSDKSLSSRWVSFETILALAGEEIARRGPLIACYLTPDVFKYDYRLRLDDQIRTRLDELDKVTRRMIDRGLDTRSIAVDRDRLVDLRNNLGKILEHITNSLTLDVREAKFEESMQLLIGSIRNRRVSRE